MVRFIAFIKVAVVGPHLEVGLNSRTGVVEFNNGALGNAVNGDCRSRVEHWGTDHAGIGPMHRLAIYNGEHRRCREGRLGGIFCRGLAGRQQTPALPGEQQAPDHRISRLGWCRGDHGKYV